MTVSTHARARWASLFCAVAAAAVASLALDRSPASAASSGQVTTSPVTLSAPAAGASPKDRVSTGWDVSMGTNHRAATVQLRSIVASFSGTCPGARTSVTVKLSMPDGTATLPAGNTARVPTAAADAHQGYEASVAVPDLCHGRAIAVASGVTFTAQLVSSDTTDPIDVRFHAIDAYQKSSNVDCSSSTQNPNGGSTCNGTWSADRTTTAAPPPPSQPSGSPSRAPATPPPAQPSSLVVVGGSSLTVITSHDSPAARPGTTQPTATPTHVVIVPPATAPPAAGNLVLGPVPVLAPSLGQVISTLGPTISWNWFILLAVLDVLLVGAVLIRRRVSTQG